MIFAQSNMKEFLYTPGMFFEIPEFQRPYSWQTSNVEEFLSDLEECIAKGKNHYFGTVVQVKDTGKAYSRAIIDGQQRVTTSLLMISAIYHLAKKNPSLIEDPETTVEKIEYQYLINKDMDNNRVKLRTVTTDNEVLQHIFDAKGEASQLEKDHQNNVYIVYSKFREYFAGKTGLDKYINGLEQFEIAVLTLVANDDNPQRVFESINSTGKPLEAGDKIRNFALMLNGDELRNHVYNEYWRPIERTLYNTDKDPITDFFRYYLISKKQSNIKLPEVYPEFKKQFGRHVGDEQEKELVDKFYSDIKRSLKFYELLKLVDTSTNKSSSELCKYAGTNELMPIDLCLEALIAECGFVARSFAGDARQVRELLKAAMSYEGTAVLDIISPCVTFNNHEESTKSYHYGKEHEEILQDISFVQAYEEIEIEQEPGTVQEVKLHDGPRILLRKLDRGHDPTDKLAAMKLLLDAREKQEFITGLIYINESRPTLTDLQHMPETPLALLPEAQIRSTPEQLAAVMAEFA